MKPTDMRTLTVIQFKTCFKPKCESCQLIAIRKLVLGIGTVYRVKFSLAFNDSRIRSLSYIRSLGWTDVKIATDIRLLKQHVNQ